MMDEAYKALIDGDILCYEMGQNQMGSFVPLKDAISNCDGKIRDIVDAAGCESYRIFLTDGPSNFRFNIATIKPYKGNRDESTKPPYWKHIRAHLLEEHGAEIVYGYEADDRLAMDQTDGTVICSRDKDLDQVPGWHYSWLCGRQKEKPLYYITKQDGLRNFYAQLILGDSSDNIPGLYRVGEITARKNLSGCTTESEMFQVVQKMYEDRFGSYWELFLTENAKLLYLLRSEDDEWKIPG